MLVVVTVSASAVPTVDVMGIVVVIVVFVVTGLLQPPNQPHWRQVVVMVVKVSVLTGPDVVVSSCKFGLAIYSKQGCKQGQGAYQAAPPAGSMAGRSPRQA